MIFSSYNFMFIFLPATLLGCGLIRRYAGVGAAKVFIVVASLVFYAQSRTLYVLILAGTLLFNYALSKYLCLEKSPAAKFALALAFIENLGVLFYFKYTGFFFESVNMIAGTDFIFRAIILPVGISFFTFQILAYSIDLYRGDIQRANLLDFSVFVTFFPQLIVGPIIRFSDMGEQLRRDDVFTYKSENIMRGVFLFSIGCGKKIILADPLITHAQAFYASSVGAGPLESWLGVMSYTFAYYFDFSGYIDMALALGIIFNIKLPINFNSPYKATSFADFWRRWNMTVSRFFEDYIFKSIFKFGGRIWKMVFAVMVTFLVSGVWHGAGWRFIAWGLFNGALVAISNILALRRVKIPKAIGFVSTFFFVVMARVIFDSSSISQALQVYKALFSLDAGIISSFVPFVNGNMLIILINIVGAAICFFAPNSGELTERLKAGWPAAVCSGALIAASLLFMGEVSDFLYFQF